MIGLTCNLCQRTSLSLPTDLSKAAYSPLYDCPSHPLALYQRTSRICLRTSLYSASQPLTRPFLKVIPSEGLKLGWPCASQPLYQLDFDTQIAKKTGDREVRWHELLISDVQSGPEMLQTGGLAHYAASQPLYLLRRFPQIERSAGTHHRVDGAKREDFDMRIGKIRRFREVGWHGTSWLQSRIVHKGSKHRQLRAYCQPTSLLIHTVRQ